MRRPSSGPPPRWSCRRRRIPSGSRGRASSEPRWCWWTTSTRRSRRCGRSRPPRDARSCTRSRDRRRPSAPRRWGSSSWSRSGPSTRASSPSAAAGSPQAIDAVRTIADSLGAPHAAPYSFELCRRYLDELVYVNDDELRDAMLLLFASAKLVTEPAGAAATAALLGPLHERLAGKRVGVIACGGNIDPATFSRHLADAVAHAERA